MIKVDNIVKRYGDYSLNISMNIPAGNITGIIGKNGAGKSTTIKSILGIVRPDEGSIQVFGKDTKKLNVKDKQDIGVALSDSGFSMYLTVDDIIHILKKMYDKFDDKEFTELCIKQGLPLNKQIKDFSTGMKAKLRVLVAISHKAKLLILDEPTSGLDIEARNDILDMLRQYMSEDENRSILISSHISSDLEGLCDDVYLIHNGKVLLHEDTDKILDEYAILKLDETGYEQIDKKYIIKTKKVSFGYECLTNQKKFYTENYPKAVMENGNIDDLILMMTGGND
ncbi:MAG: ABC transporter ATP-binding protein [Lachnospiraceae bacterium]|nr:ABC transporter ATP-binding protein [Lachnospiraceae bacterium]MBQ2406133.1 ABC transporter ATP-binding protein [Lachnospiraceae bacterium]